MRNLEELVALAIGHVSEGRRIVAKQRALLAQNPTTPEAVQLLRTFEQSQEIFEADLDRLLQEQGRM